jgi:hypothetical protein
MGTHFVFLILPLVLANVLHMIVVKKNHFAVLNKPINTNAFGSNKTWRGFVFVPLINAFLLFLFSFLLPQYSPIFSAVLGFAFGLAYMLSELPNSYLKRRIGIASGAQALSNAWIFSLIDKSDSALGVCLTYLVLTSAPFMQVFYLFIISIFLHISISYTLVKLKIKRSF